MKAEHTLAVFLLWMGSLHTIWSVDTTSNESKKPEQGQRHVNKWEVRREERSVPFVDLTLDDDNGGESTNGNSADGATRAVQPATYQRAVRVGRMLRLRRARRLRRERRRQNRDRGQERVRESNIAQHENNTAATDVVISLLTDDEESISEDNNADVSEKSTKEADPPSQEETPNEQEKRKQNQVDHAREVTPEMQEKDTKKRKVIKDQANQVDDNEENDDTGEQYEAFQLEESIRLSMLESNRRLTRYTNNSSNRTRTYNIVPRPVPFGRTAQNLNGYFEVEGIGMGYDNGFACMNTSKTVCDSVVLSKTVPRKENDHSQQGKSTGNDEQGMEDESKGENRDREEGKTSTARQEINIQPATEEKSTSSERRAATTNESDESKKEGTQQQVIENRTRDDAGTGLAIPDAETPPYDDWQHRPWTHQATREQTCGSTCTRGIKVGDFIIKNKGHGGIRWRHITCGDPVGELMLRSVHCSTPKTTTTPAAATQNMNTGTRSQAEGNGTRRDDTTPALQLPTLVITPQQRLRMEQNRLRALEIRRLRQIEQNKDTQDHNPKEKGQAKTNSMNDTDDDGTNKASGDKVVSVQAPANESETQELPGINTKHSNTMSRPSTTKNKVNTVTKQQEQSALKRTTPGRSNANGNIHGELNADSDKDSGTDDDSRHTTTSEDDYDDQDSFIASENSSTRRYNANDSESEEWNTNDESESESEEDSTDTNEERSNNSNVDSERNHSSDSSSIRESDSPLANSDEENKDKPNVSEGKAKGVRRSQRKTNRPRYREENSDDNNSDSMIDDYSSGAYDENAFGSDNDDDASIRTKGSEIDNRTKARVATSDNAEGEAIRTDPINNRGNNNHDISSNEGGGRVEEQRTEASSGGLDENNDTQQGNRQLRDMNNQQQGLHQELEATGNIEVNDTQVGGDNNNESEHEYNNSHGTDDEQSATNTRRNGSNTRQTTVEECRPYHVSRSDRTRDE